MTSQEYREIKKRTYRKYKKIKKVFCPYFKKEVIFNSQGFWHIIYTGRNSKREQSSQLQRFRLLGNAVELLKITHTLQEYEQITRNSQKIFYYGFIAIFKKDKIKVIIKKIERGKLIFWSIIPNWITSKKRDRRLFKGSLEKD